MMCRFGWLSALALGLGLSASASQAAFTERAGRIAAAELVDPALLAGPGFRVEPQASLRGLQARFRVTTVWGALEADSVELLEVRISEMAAVSTVYSHGFSQALKEAGIDQLSSPWSDAQQLASAPVQRLKQLPAGVLRYFSERWQRWSERARRLGDRADNALSHEGRAGTGFGLVEPAATQDVEEPWWDAPVDELGRVLRSEAGHARARRALAAHLGIDAATSNPLLRDRLDKLAWAIAGQRLAYDTALQWALPGVARAIAEIGRAEDLTAAAPEEHLRRVNERQLERWSADADLRYGLAWRSAFSPNLLQQLLDALAELEPAAGGEAVLDVARMASNELEARFVLNSLRLLQSPRVAAARGGRFQPVGALLGYVDPRGEFYLPLPVDRLSWLKEVRQWFDHHAVSSHPRRTVLIGGGISPLAQRAITRRGWSLLGQVEYPGAPAYLRRGLAP